jgi:glycosyltransferase involved in cell wall biosynthesis
MVIKILSIGDVANNTEVMRKYLKKSSISIIHFPNKYSKIQVLGENEQFFESLNIFESVKKINEISGNFDLCFVTSWAGARIAFLADLNYVIYFVGSDIQAPPFLKKPESNPLMLSSWHHNFLERAFYKKVLDSAIACVAADPILYESLKKYRKDAIRMDRICIDYEIYNQDIKPIERTKTKFTFFSPQRFVYFKGMDLIFKAISLCKSEFEILQVEWFDDPSQEGNEIMANLLKNVPNQIKFIPIMKRDEVARYYAFSDAVLGQMRYGLLGGIEREASLCKKPVIVYYNLNNTYFLDDSYVVAPFLPNSNEPNEIAKIIDMVVESKEFCEKLATKEYEFVRNLTDPQKAAAVWDDLFESLHNKYGTIRKKSSSYVIKFRKALFLLGYVTNLNRIKNKMRNKISN